MHNMNDLLKIPELKDAMSKLAREMEKAGYIQEILDDSFTQLEVTLLLSIYGLLISGFDNYQDADLDSQTDTELEKILSEIATELKTPDLLPNSSVAKPQTNTGISDNNNEQDIVDKEIEDMQKRLASL